MAALSEIPRQSLSVGNSGDLEVVCETFKELFGAVAVFHDSLYVQKHAFYFGEVAQWRDDLKVMYTAYYVKWRTKFN